MIFILGCLSLTQILVLPGAILLKFFNLRRSAMQTIAYVFGLSLIFNFLWVLVLTSLKINYPVLHYLLFALEIGLIGWMYRGLFSLTTGEFAADLNSRINETLGKLEILFQKGSQEPPLTRFIKSLVVIIFFAWTIASLLWVGKLLITNFGTVFHEWDAVVSWNGWAGKWFNNVIPSPSRYPQLIPANFSVTYSFIGGTDIQIFAKSFMPLFTIITWLLIVDLAFDYEQPGFLIGVVILRYMTKKFLGIYIGEGYVDVALLFFSFLTVYTLLKAVKTEDTSKRLQYVYLGAVFAAGTALAKQNGLLMFVFYPVLALILMVEQITLSSLWKQSKFLIKPMMLGLLVLLPWYLLNESRILLGLNGTNVEFLISAERHSGRSYFERAVRALEMLEIYKYLFLVVLVTLPLFPKKFRQVALITIFPYTIIWLFLFSIFTRNLAMVFPFLALFAGFGLAELMHYFLGFGQKLKLHRLPVIFYMIPIVLIILGASLIFTNQKLTELQNTDQKEALLANVNRPLYAYFDEQGDYGPIMTKYPIEYLPSLKDFKIYESFANYPEFYQNFSDHPETAYFLIWERFVGDDVLAQIDAFQDAGAVELHFNKGNMLFYEVIDREVILNTRP